MEILNFDIAFIHLIQTFQPNWLTLIMKFISLISSTKSYLFIVPIIAIFFYIKHYRKEAFFTIFIVLGNIFNPIIKNIVNRARPTGDIVNILETKTNSSFPSGHALGAIIFYGFLIYLIWKLPFKHKKIITLILTIFILLVGLSRIYLGAHWPSDVFGGYFIGTVWIIFMAYIYRRSKKGRFMLSSFRKH